MNACTISFLTFCNNYSYKWFPLTDRCTLFWFSVDGLSIPEEEKSAYEWLQEREELEDLEVNGKMYNGPKIVES